LDKKKKLIKKIRTDHLIGPECYFRLPKTNIFWLKISNDKLLFFHSLK